MARLKISREREAIREEFGIAQRDMVIGALQVVLPRKKDWKFY